MALELLTPAEMARVDARAAQLGAPTRMLMENAGRAVAETAMRRWPGRKIAVLCGPGNNGGDGYVAARLLAEAGWAVRVAALTPKESLKGDAAAAALAWRGSVAALAADGVAPDEWVIDALFGAGLSAPLAGVSAALANALASDPARVLAVDTPSGVRGDGSPPDGAAFAAGVTVTFCRKKPAHVLYPSRALCGDIELADIGVPERALEESGVRAWENAASLWRDKFPWPGVQTHKHQRGRVGVASGGPANTGAARLAARAALRAGAGLVTVFSPPSAVLVNASHLTAIMLTAFADEHELAASSAKMNALVLGPAFGLGAQTQRTVAAVAARGNALVLDADALTSFAGAPEELFALVHGQCVLTPHAGEFQRLFPDLAESRISKLEKTRRAAVRAGCVVLFKGPDTVVASPDGRAAVNTNAPAFLATAGAGDVLAGIIAGLAAQGMAAWEAACAGAWMHGAAGEMLGPGLIAEDLPEALAAVLRRLGGRAERP